MAVGSNATPPHIRPYPGVGSGGQPLVISRTLCRELAVPFLAEGPMADVALPTSESAPTAPSEPKQSQPQPVALTAEASGEPSETKPELDTWEKTITETIPEPLTLPGATQRGKRDYPRTPAKPTSRTEHHDLDIGFPRKEDYGSTTSSAAQRSADAERALE